MKIPIQEKKKYVINLHKRGSTVRQIVQELHISSRDVIEVLKEYEREEHEAREKEVIEKEENEKKRNFSSKRSDALQLYKEKVNPLDVAIQLEIHPEEAKAIFLQYLSLQNLENLVTIYHKLNNNHALESLIDLHFYMQENNINEEKIVELNKIVDSLPRIREEYFDTSEQLSSIKTQRDQAISNNRFFQNKIYEMNRNLNKLLNAIDSKKNELQTINIEIFQKKQFLEYIKNSEEYKNLEKKIENQIDKCLSQKKDFIKLSIETILKFMKKDKNTKFLIKNLFYSSHLFVDHYISNYENQIIDMTNILYDNIVKSIKNKIINS